MFFAFIFKKSSYNIVEKKYDNVNKDKNYYTVIGKKYERIYPMQINDSENPSGGLYYYLFLITKVLTITFWLLFVIHVVFFIYDQSMYISMWKNTFNILKNLLITENCIELYIELYREFYAILYVFVLVSIIEVIISLMVKGFARSFNVIVKWCKNL